MRNVKNITLTVPVEIHKEMQKWKKDINFSRLFVNAFKEFIKTYETNMKEIEKMSEKTRKLEEEMGCFRK